MKVSSATVLICTYDRAESLRDTLQAMQAMLQPTDCDVEIVVVDNNSPDHTSSVVAESAAAGPLRVVYLREHMQGKSFALNRGLDYSRADIVALTDDDVLPAADWLERIVDAFRTNDLTFVFGKVLPRWETMPPPELLTDEAQEIWGPLALVDYGDEPTWYDADDRGLRLPIGANLAFARSALVHIGGWRTDLGKVNNTLISGEDHEIFMRLRRHDLYRGLYDPRNGVRHFVPASRLTRRYFRRWFYWNGRTRALMLQDLYPELDVERARKIGGVPRFLYRQGLEQAYRYLRSLGRRDALNELLEELLTIRYAGLYAECWRRQWKGPNHRVPIQAPATPDRSRGVEGHHKVRPYV
jgi:glycosyltransferase involved in cell wall biosynthesis